MATVTIPAAWNRPLPSGRDYISFSAINTLQACSLRYFFKYVHGLPEERRQRHGCETKTQTILCAWLSGSGGHSRRALSVFYGFRPGRYRAVGRQLLFGRNPAHEAALGPC